MSTRAKHIRHAATAFCMLALSPLLMPAAGQSFEEGVSAYHQGDYATALENFRPLAEQGDPWAQVLLGVMYEDGEGVPQDYAEAARWYRLAAEWGHPMAQFNLGVMYDNGQGVLQDYAEAVTWYHRAAEQGNERAQTNLGVMYGLGQGVLQDYATAYMWGNIAAANGARPDLRDLMAEQLSPEQIVEAQRRARVCMESNYQDCD